MMETQQIARGGRPTKQPNERRTAQIKIRFTLAEDEHVRLLASRARLTITDFIRNAALKVKIQPPRPGIDTELLRELNSIGVNINQIARALNRGQDAPSYLNAILKKLSRTLDQVAARYGP